MPEKLGVWKDWSIFVEKQFAYEALLAWLDNNK